jgi:hypothetical protein
MCVRFLKNSFLKRLDRSVYFIFGMSMKICPDNSNLIKISDTLHEFLAAFYCCGYINSP